VGWTKDTPGTSAQYTNAQSILNLTQTDNDIITFYAVWQARNFTVTFDAQGGNVDPASTVVTYDDTYGDLPTPTRTGYTFDGWFTAEDGAGTQITSTTPVAITEAQTLYRRGPSTPMRNFERTRRNVTGK
jgi:uncharacterized repeat protein (TIGR02543 family)